MIVVEKGIMKEECSILYNREVRKELEKLRGASDDQLRIQDREREARRIEAVLFFALSLIGIALAIVFYSNVRETQEGPP